MLKLQPQNRSFNSKRSNAPLIGMPTWSDDSTAYNGVSLFALNQSYVDAIVEAGGIPFMIPLNLDLDRLWALFCKLDGLFLAGGTDIHPALYDEKVAGSEGRFDDRRDVVEIQLAQWALETDLPIFGICRGMQMINVAAGGTLYHDLKIERPESDKHDFFGAGADRQVIRHNIFVESNSYLGRTLGEIVGVNSMHHQAVKELGAFLNATAISEDGLIEGIEGSEHAFVVGCQWHPEELSADPHQAQLFADFITAASSQNLGMPNNGRKLMNGATII